METLGQLAEALRARGLFVGTDSQKVLIAGIHRTDVTYDESYPHAIRFLRDVHITQLHLDDCVVFLEDEVRVERHDRGWVLFNRLPSHYGGINCDRVRHIFDSLDEVLSGVIDYFFQEPIEVGDWILPVGQHPSWDIAKVIEAIETARKVDSDSMTAILREASDKLGDCDPCGADPSILKKVAHLVFYKAKPRRIGAPELFLRYDCEEAYICVGAEMERSSTI